MTLIRVDLLVIVHSFRLNLQRTTTYNFNSEDQETMLSEPVSAITQVL
jgi:hypothetical protein